MGARPAAFTEADIKRAIRAAQAVGVAHPCVEITKDGTLRIITATVPAPKAVDGKKRPVL